MRGEHFVHLDKSIALAPRQHVFGTAKASEGAIEALPVAKTGRKTMQLLDTIQQHGVVGSDLQVQNMALQYTTSGFGDPGFTFMHMTDNDGRGWYVHPRVLHLKNDGVSADAQLLFRDDLKDAVQIVSGTCLFGATGVEARTASGEIRHITDAIDVAEMKEPVESISVADTLHPYEVETALRLTNFFHFLSSAKVGGSVNFHVPHMEYKGYGWDLYQRGLMDAALLKQWFSEVDQRAAGVKDIIEKRLPKNLEMHPVAPLWPIEDIWGDLLSLPADEAMKKACLQLSSADSV